MADLFKKVAVIALCAMAINLPAQALPANDVNPPPLHSRDFGNKIGIEFSKTPAFQEETDKAIEGAYAACKKFLSEKKDDSIKAAIVSDLDETLIDNRPHFETQQHFSWTAFEGWIKKADAPLLPRTAEFLTWARKNGFAIFFITGRREGLRHDTVANLKKRGVEYDGLLMRKEFNLSGAETVKVPLREEVEKMGYKIVVNIGDQWSDLKGGHAEDCEKLPNKIYLVK